MRLRRTRRPTGTATRPAEPVVRPAGRVRRRPTRWSPPRARPTAAGYTRMDGYSPYPVGEAADALGFPKSEMGPVMFIGGLTGAVRRLLHAVLGERLRLPAEHRRPAVLELAVVHPDHVRDDGADDGADRAVRADRHLRPAAL